MQPLQLEPITAGGDCAVLRVAGEIDVYTAPRLRERLAELAAGGVRHVVADLRAVDFLDSTGLGALVGGLKRLREQDGSLALVAGDGKILRVLQITGLVRAFALHASVTEAIGAGRHWQAALAREGRSPGEWCRDHGLR